MTSKSRHPSTPLSCRSDREDCLKRGQSGLDLPSAGDNGIRTHEVCPITTTRKEWTGRRMESADFARPCVTREYAPQAIRAGTAAAGLVAPAPSHRWRVRGDGT